MTARQGSHGRQLTCAVCGRSLGMLPSGRAVPWRSEIYRVSAAEIGPRIVCADASKCRLYRLTKSP